MHRFHRKTAPGVRGGQVRKKNNWRLSPSCYRVPQFVPAVDRRRPGLGYRHLLRKSDIERFIEILPHWEDLSRGLNVIVLDRGRWGCDGWYNRGVIGICAWPLQMTVELDRTWYSQHRDLLVRIGAQVSDEGANRPVIIHWTPATARAYQLCHVFLHELGHHNDRMTTRSRRDNAPRGENYAEQYAWASEVLLWDRYLEAFGLPD